MSLSIGGITYSVPGSYALAKVVQLGDSALPDFSVGVIIGEQMKGIPYLEGMAGSPAKGGDIILPYANITDLITDKGDEGDNKIATFFRYAKKMGAGTIFTLGVNPTTKLKDGVIQNVTPVDALKITSVDYGAHVNDISITIAASVHTIIPPKNTTFLTADSGTGKTISVKNIKKFVVGETWYITDNLYAAPVAKVIESVDAVAKTVTFTAVIAASAVIASYARVFQEDTRNQEVSIALTTPATVTAFYNQSKNLRAAIVGVVTLMPVTLAKAYIQNLTGATKATSPAATATDWQNVADNFQRWNEEFAQKNKVYLRVVGLVTSDVANHAAFRDLAVAMRTANKPIAIVSGCAIGDYLSTNSANSSYPSKRTFTLNSGDFQLAGAGLDGLNAYISLAGELFGIRLANAVNHNQTADGIICDSVEVAYYKEDVAMTTWIKAGVIFPLLSSTGYKVPQGISTYQDQSVVFNVQTRDTYLIRNRDLADFDLKAIMQVLDAAVGADVLNAQILSGIVVNRSISLRDNYEYIKSFKISKIYKVDNAWIIERGVGIDNPDDFVGLINTIFIN